MFERVKKSRKAAGDGGFTLIELLVVIIILGILAAVVVFAVGGVGDKGQNASCKIDTRTLRTAEEAYAAQALPNGGGGNYGEEADLVGGGFLSEESQWHTITNIVLEDTATPQSEADFTIEVAGDGIGKCGPGGPVGTSGNV